MTESLRTESEHAGGETVVLHSVGPGGTMAADSAFAVALVGLWHRAALADSIGELGSETSRSDIAARVPVLVDRLKKGQAVGTAAIRGRHLVGFALLRFGVAARRHTGTVEVLIADPETESVGPAALLQTVLNGVCAAASKDGVELVEIAVPEHSPAMEAAGAAGWQEVGRRPGWIRPIKGSDRSEVLYQGSVLPG